MTNIQDINELTWVVVWIFFHTLPGVILFLAHVYRNDHEGLEDVQFHAKEKLESLLTEYLNMAKSYLDLVFNRASPEDLARLKEEIDNLANTIKASLDSYYTLEANLHATGGEVLYFHLQLQGAFDNISSYYENVLSMGVFS